MPTALKDVGTALAILAIYMLVLLSPLHQAAGLQRELDQLGFTSLDNWSVCGQLANGNDEDGLPVVKCAASGIGKNEVALPANGPVPLRFVRVFATAPYWRPDALPYRQTPYFAGQPRAPPIAI